jgi:hypothetical protein
MGTRLSTLATAAILAFFAGVSVSFFTLPLWVAGIINYAKAGSRSDWLGFVGGMVAAVVAATAVYFGWQGVKRQLRTNVISREEERIERQLPGLREVAGGLEQLFPKPLSKGSLMLIALAPLRGDHSGVNDHDIKRWFPQADPSTLQALLIILQQLEEAAAMLASAERAESPTVGIHALVFLHAQERLTQFKAMIIDKVALYERRGQKIRLEIEEYFDQGHRS